MTTNIIVDDSLIIEYYKKFHDLPKEERHSLDLFKKKLGKQQTTINCERRNWIWSFTNDENDATIYCFVNNSQGVSFEYDQISNIENIKPLFYEIMKRLFESK